MIRVNPRAQHHRDRGGDPLDGLVNMFDLGIVLAVAFLLAALQSVDLTDLLTKKDVTVVRTAAAGRRRHQARRAAADPAPQRPPGAGDGGARRLGLPPAPTAGSCSWTAEEGRERVRRRALAGLALVTTGDEQVVDITLRTAADRVRGDRVRRRDRRCRSASGWAWRASAAGARCSRASTPGCGCRRWRSARSLWLLMWPDSQWGGGPLAGLGWIYTLNAVILAQTLLALPVVVALTVAAVQACRPGCSSRPRALGARGPRLGMLALREARIGVLAAIIAALGTATASVGAVLVVGTSLGTATLASAALAAWNGGGEDARAVAYGIVLLGLFLVAGRRPHDPPTAAAHAMAAGPVLTAEGLAVARAGRVLVDGFDLELHRGELVAVLGPNGVGKSSLLATLAGLLRAGRRPGARRRPGRRRAAGARARPALGAGERRGRARLVGRAPPRAARRGRRPRSPPCGPTASRDRRADTLSGGEARRVHLARAVALRADVLLLDEPFAGLDAPTRAELLRDAAAILRDPARATLVVLHDRAEAWALADRLLVLLDGRVAAHGDAARRCSSARRARAVARFLGFTGSDRASRRRRALRAARTRRARRGRSRARHGRGAASPRRTACCARSRLDGGARAGARARIPGPPRARPCGCASTAAWCSPDGVPRRHGRAGAGADRRRRRRDLVDDAGARCGSRSSRPCSRSLLGLPIGFWLGEARTRPRRAGMVVANAGLGLPPVVLGVFLALLLLPGVAARAAAAGRARCPP